MEKNVDSSCPADLKKTGMLSSHGKYWQTKGMLSTWSKDKNMKLTCHQHNKGFNNGKKRKSKIDELTVPCKLSEMFKM